MVRLDVETRPLIESALPAIQSLEAEPELWACHGAKSSADHTRRRAPTNDARFLRLEIAGKAELPNWGDTKRWQFLIILSSALLLFCLCLTTWVCYDMRKAAKASNVNDVDDDADRSVQMVEVGEGEQI